ncbi:MAG TPA: anhydro-N-acetylmuramic acid kinase [Gemmatimonadales bacterium]|nr:anhydro-N-acetylmuramic acid kinase [Gemmatimonadales bacterium]
MTERPSLIVGLMSGTSLDGMDAALVRFRGPTQAELVAFASRPYDAEERAELRAALEGRAAAPALARLHVRIAEWAAEAVQSVLHAGGTRADGVDGIAFPGQTIWHEPPLVSWQLGEPAVLAESFGTRIVHSFRARDVAAGGQGAPLVPMADLLLFGSADRSRVLLNLGGMANITLVPGGGREAGAIAFDTGPGMAIIDALAHRVDPSLTCDLDGVLSATGTVDEVVVRELLAAEYFRRPPPKSTGRELFGDGYASALHARVPGANGVATAVALTARSVAAGVRQWAPGAGEVVVSGGGVHHPGLMTALAQLLDPLPLRRFDELFFDGDAKEAVAFALLGYLTLHGQPGNLPAATGARGARILGSITPP